MNQKSSLREVLQFVSRVLTGNKCYNAKIQNYGAWDVWEGEGRSFRFPVTDIRDGQEE